jgi:hypothetical protein
VLLAIAQVTVLATMLSARLPIERLLSFDQRYRIERERAGGRTGPAEDRLE